MSAPADTNREEAGRWLVQAREELVVASVLAASPEAPPRSACFHAHLAAEKALKAWLIFCEQPFRKVHDLLELRALLPEVQAGAVDEAELELLNPWALEGRYPGDVPDASREDAHECMAAAEHIVETVSVQLQG